MKCEFIKPDGIKCEAHAIKDSEFCYLHNPNISDEEKLDAQTRGGQARGLRIKEPLPELVLAKPDDIFLLITDTIQRVRAGELDTRIANCLFFGADKLTRAFEVIKYNQRMDYLEELFIKQQTEK